MFHLLQARVLEHVVYGLQRARKMSKENVGVRTF